MQSTDCLTDWLEVFPASGNYLYHLDWNNFQRSAFCTQAIQEMNFTGYRDQKSIKITGFSIVDYTNEKVKAFLRDWMKLNESYWHAGAGSDTITVSARMLGRNGWWHCIPDYTMYIIIIIEGIDNPVS